MFEDDRFELETYSEIAAPIFKLHVVQIFSAAMAELKARSYDSLLFDIHRKQNNQTFSEGLTLMSLAKENNHGIVVCGMSTDASTKCDAMDHFEEKPLLDEKILIEVLYTAKENTVS